MKKPAGEAGFSAFSEACDHQTSFDHEPGFRLRGGQRGMFNQLRRAAGRCLADKLCVLTIMATTNSTHNHLGFL
jgi:hypothetical protein